MQKQNSARASLFDVIIYVVFSVFGLQPSFHVQVSAETANEFGELVADPVTNELLHYTEKPETFVCKTFRHSTLSIFLSIVVSLSGELTFEVLFFPVFSLGGLIFWCNAGKWPNKLWGLHIYPRYFYCHPGGFHSEERQRLVI